MSFPFGSGMPPNTTGSYPPPPHHHHHHHQQQHHSVPYPTQSPPFGSGMPPQQGGAYPPQGGAYPPQGGAYPPQGGYGQPYPPSSGGAPYAPNSGGAPYPPTSGAPYPSPSHTAPYPSAYPPNTSPYPSSQPYPPAQPPQHQRSFDDSPEYPRQSYHPSPYPVSQPQYPSPNTTTQPMYPSMPQGSYGGYPMQQPIYGGSGTLRTSHIGAAPSFATYRREHSKGTPSVVPAGNFNAVEDAQVLRKAMKGWGTDEDAIINVICRRSNEQRQQIEKEYKTNFGKDLIDDLKSETSGNFENLLIALMTPIVDFYVHELHHAMAGLGTDEDVLIEILCSMSNYEINIIKDAYERKHGKNLESELMSETSGNFKRLLVSLCAAGRDESGVVDAQHAMEDATALLRAGELRVGTDESTFNMVLCQRNFAQIRLICDEYERMTGHSLEKAIENEFSGDILDGLVAIIQCTSNKAEFFARRLHKSMAGLGTTDSQLIRIIVTRSEVDLIDIKHAFERLYGESLRSWIKGDTSGHYKHALYALIGEERSG